LLKYAIVFAAERVVANQPNKNLREVKSTVTIP